MHVSSSILLPHQKDFPTKLCYPRPSSRAGSRTLSSDLPCPARPTHLHPSLILHKQAPQRITSSTHIAPLTMTPVTCNRARAARPDADASESCSTRDAVGVITWTRGRE